MQKVTEFLVHVRDRCRAAVALALATDTDVQQWALQE